MTEVRREQFRPGGEVYETPVDSSGPAGTRERLIRQAQDDIRDYMPDADLQAIRWAAAQTVATVLDNVDLVKCGMLDHEGRIAELQHRVNEFQAALDTANANLISEIDRAVAREKQEPARTRAAVVDALRNMAALLGGDLGDAREVSRRADLVERGAHW